MKKKTHIDFGSEVIGRSIKTKKKESKKDLKVKIEDLPQIIRKKK